MSRLDENDVVGINTRSIVALQWWPGNEVSQFSPSSLLPSSVPVGNSCLSFIWTETCLIATLGLHLELSAKLRIWQVLAFRWSKLRSGTIITDWASQPAINLLWYFSHFNVVRWPPSQYMFFRHHNCSPHQENMCGVPPPSICFFSAVSPVPCQTRLCLRKYYS